MGDTCMADAKSDTSDTVEIDDAEIVTEENHDDYHEDVVETVDDTDLEPIPNYDDPDERHPSLSSRVLTWLAVLVAGAGIALWGGPKLAPQLPEWAAPVSKFLTPGGDAATRDVAALRAEVTERLEAVPQGPSTEELVELVKSELDALQASNEEKFAALEGKLASADTSTMDARIGGIETQVEGLSAELGALTTSVQSALSQGGTVSEETLAEITSKSAEVEGLRAQLGEMTGQIGALTQRIEDAENAAKARVDEALAEAEQAKKQAAKIASNSAFQGALDELTIQARLGQPYEAQLAAFSDASDMEIPAILSENAVTGIAAVSILKEQYSDLSHKAIRASIKADAGDDAGSVSKLGAFLKSQVATRSLGPVEGDSTDAILSRMDAALQNGELSSVIAEAEGLSETARSTLADWLTSVETRKAVLDTLAALASQPS